MSEKLLRNIFIVGTVLCLGLLAVLSFDTLNKVQAGRTPPVTDQVALGKQVWQSKNCNDCHTILGIGGYFAPELTKVADRRGSDWLMTFLKSPQSAAPSTPMPNQHLVDADVEELTAFFQWVAKVNTNNWPPQAMAAAGGTGTGPSATLLIQQKGCLGCHTIGSQGASGPGPNLSHIGGVLDANTIVKVLTDPKSVNPAATMPRLTMTDAERQTIAEYLSGLK